MNFKKLLLFGFLISTGLLHAQTDFRSGYIIQESGDTIYGNIDYRGNSLMGRVCKFRDDDDGTISEYTPHDIVSYRFIDGKYYVSREIENGKVFLEYLIKGKINIYYMRDNGGDHYYLDKDDVNLTKIPYEEGIKYVDNRPIMYESKTHIGILNYYMKDADEFQSRVYSIKKPEHKNLIKLAEDYHNAVCQEGESCIVYEKKLPLFKASIAPFIGLVKYNGYDKFKAEIGGYVYIWSPRANENLYVKTGLIYHKSPDEESESSVFKIPLQLQYIYKAHKVQPKISGGFNFMNMKFDEYNELGHTLCLNAGFNYLVSDGVSLTTDFNTDYTPLGKVMVNKDYKFNLISYSIIVGLRFNL